MSPPGPASATPPLSTPLALLLVVAVALAGNLLSIAAPGFYSHDELQLLDQLRHTGQLTHLDLTDVAGLRNATFFRPIGYSLLARVLASSHPVLAGHLLSGLAHALAACAVYLATRPFLRRAALAVTLLFAVSPLTTFSVSWVVAIYELTYFLFGALALAAFCRYWRGGHVLLLVGAAAGTAAALASKETAVALLPAVLLLALADRDRMLRPRAVLALAVTAVLVGSYLALRFPALAGGARGGGGYGIDPSPANLATNATTYLLFPLTPRVVESQTLWLSRTPVLLLAAVLHGGLFVLLLLRHRWRALLYPLGYLAPLGPVLLISKNESQYLYASAVAFALLLVLVWRGWRAWPARALVVLAVAIASLHTGRIGLDFYDMAQCQTRLLDDFAHLAGADHRAADGNVTISAEPGSPDWVLARAIFDRHVRFADGEFPVRATPQPDAAALRFNASCNVSLHAAAPAR
ncbi:glycosyltransferase family 39 protein [Derxia lacustris]|uniref:glycosyltransferase family 39 protein n=1 Tax=Derxia lacustris TaxID=764842 RepID=UPI0015933808|nr:glycosyltransferase family 39 protein [Derxia lacustris]